jgi:zinc transport system substrate-binding protein
VQVQTEPVVAVSILPQAWFVERIAGERAETMTLAGPGQNPHTFEISPKQLLNLARAKVWLLSGDEFEMSLRPKVEKVFKNLIIVDGTEGVNFRNLDPNEIDDDGDAISDGIDRHTWLGEEPVKIMAAHIRDVLSEIDPEGESFYRQNYRELVDDIEAEFNNLRAELSPLRGSAVFVYHPAFGYFLDEFGLIQEAVETGGKEPTMQTLYALIQKAKEERPAAIFVQAQFPVIAAKTASRAVGADVIALDPLSKDWLNNIGNMGEALKMVIRSKHEYNTSQNTSQ